MPREEVESDEGGRGGSGEGGVGITAINQCMHSNLLTSVVIYQSTTDTNQISSAVMCKIGICVILGLAWANLEFQIYVPNPRIVLTLKP